MSPSIPGWLVATPSVFSYTVSDPVCCRHSFLSVKASKEENSTCLCVCKEKGICKEVFEICFKD